MIFVSASFILLILQNPVIEFLLYGSSQMHSWFLHQTICLVELWVLISVISATPLFWLPAPPPTPAPTPTISHKADVFFQDFSEIHIVCFFWPPTNLSTCDFPLVANLPFFQLLSCLKGHCLLWVSYALLNCLLFWGIGDWQTTLL